MKKTIFVLIILLSFNFTQGYFEFDFGVQNPQGTFDKYNEPGFSMRATYTHVDELFPFIRYDFSMQYLQFKKDVWNEYYEELNSPLTYENSEQAFGVFLGPRLMSPTQHGVFRPYVGFKIGGMFFNETMKISWEEPDDTFMQCITGTLISGLFDADYDCDGDTRVLSKDYLDMSLDFGALLEIGSNMNFSDNFGLDFGIQYNIIPSIRPEIVMDESGEEFNEISKTINADYITFYIGINFKIGE